MTRRPSGNGSPLVSVLLPVFNGADALEQALESLRTQTYRNFEVLVLDDGSTDLSLDTARRFAALESRFRVLPLEHGGIVNALNHGLKLVQGKYIARMDHDDICLPRRLELQCAHLEAAPDTGLVACRVRFGGDRKKQAGYAHYVDWTNSLLSPEDIDLARFRESPFAHPSVMFRASLVRDFGGYRQGDFPEDYELWLRWLEAGVRMSKLDQELLVWNDPPQRLSRSDTRYDPQRFYEIKAGYLARWLRQHNPLHPEVHILGAGRVSRKRAEALCGHGIEITTYYDIDPRKIGKVVHGRPVLSREEVPPPGGAFLISYVGSRKAGEDISDFLVCRGHVPGRHFLLAA